MKAPRYHNAEPQKQTLINNNYLPVNSVKLSTNAKVKINFNHAKFFAKNTTVYPNNQLYIFAFLRFMYFGTNENANCRIKYILRQDEVFVTIEEFALLGAKIINELFRQ